MKKIVLLVFVFLLFSTAVVVGFVSPVVAEGTIYIRSDGSVVGTDRIQRNGNIYTFTGNISGGIDKRKLGTFRDYVNLTLSSKPDVCMQ